jgi:hypothetical protein
MKKSTTANAEGKRGARRLARGATSCALVALGLGVWGCDESREAVAEREAHQSMAEQLGGYVKCLGAEDAADLRKQMLGTCMARSGVTKTKVKTCRETLANDAKKVLAKAKEKSRNRLSPEFEKKYDPVFREVLPDMGQPCGPLTTAVCEDAKRLLAIGTGVPDFASPAKLACTEPPAKVEALSGRTLRVAGGRVEARDGGAWKTKHDLSAEQLEILFVHEGDDGKLVFAVAKKKVDEAAKEKGKDKELGKKPASDDPKDKDKKKKEEQDDVFFYAPEGEALKKVGEAKVKRGALRVVTGHATDKEWLVAGRHTDDEEGTSGLAVLRWSLADKAASAHVDPLLDVSHALSCGRGEQSYLFVANAGGAHVLRRDGAEWKNLDDIPSRLGFPGLICHDKAVVLLARSGDGRLLAGDVTNGLAAGLSHTTASGPIAYAPREGGIAILSRDALFTLSLPLLKANKELEAKLVSAAVTLPQGAERVRVEGVPFTLRTASAADTDD